jgi:membrane-associated phospholipid phosphatase
MSFPSGDASTAFAIASVVASEYDNMFVPPIVYGISTLVALQRVYTNAHWASDVFVASAIGYFTGKAVVASHSKKSNLSFVPWIDGQDMGVMVTYRY